MGLVFFFLHFLVLFLPLSTAAAVLPAPLLALLSLKSALDDPLNTLNSWTPSPPPLTNNQNPSASQHWCSFSGVTCAPTNASAIVSIDLSSRSLSFSRTPEFPLLLLAPTLLHLNLSSNAFSGPLPPSILSLRRLRTLDISRNNFSGPFPPGLSIMRRLQVLDAYSNSFEEEIPREVGALPCLEVLNLGGSFFTGRVPGEQLGSLPKLRVLHLAGNLLTGPLPPELAAATELERVELGYNAFEGGVPPQWGSMSRLNYLDVASANLSGQLPDEFGNLTSLQYLFLFENNFTGSIPAAYSALATLQVLDLSNNRLSGSIPDEFGSSLHNLTILSLMNNMLSGPIPPGFADLPNLETLLLWNNSLTGPLPSNLGANGRLVKLDVSSNALSGPVPPTLCSGGTLVRLILFSNNFDSTLPQVLANCTSLWRLRIESNNISGPIPAGLGLLPNLTYVDLSDNGFSGEIPPDLGNSTSIQLLNISNNPLMSALPETIWMAQSLQVFSASKSGLRGPIPQFRYGCKSLYSVELDGNELSGSIPWDIGGCVKLLTVRLDGNRLTGIIPWELAALPAITDVDLSNNLLVGAIPSSFDNCTTLEGFNVSHNRLTGAIPSSGTDSVLRGLHPSSFSGNEGLCGPPLARQCEFSVPEEVDGGGGDDGAITGPKSRSTPGATIVWIAAGAFGVALLVTIAVTRLIQGRLASGGSGDRGPGPWKVTAFQRLNFTADDVAECVEVSENIVGVGSAGTVYRAEMPNGDVIAVKKLWGKQKIQGGGWAATKKCNGAAGGPSLALAEVEVLGSVRHRNIVRLLGCCSNRDTTLLLYEYMPNGSLDDFLHRRPYASPILDKGGAVGVGEWETRYKVAVGVAQGLRYLHHDCNPAIVHRDLKPSNILLDAEMEARVADFGVAKLLLTRSAAGQTPGRGETMSAVAGSYGYIAPEYAYALRVDEKSDVYSYGVVLLEMVTGRRAVEGEYGEGNSIAEWVRMKAKSVEAAWWEDVLDNRVVPAAGDAAREEMVLLLRVALLCTSRNPADRPTMRDVASMLQERKRKPKGGQESDTPKKTFGGSLDMTV